MAVAIQKLNARQHQQETAMTIFAEERERLLQQVQSMSSMPRQRVQAGVVDTRVIGKPDQFDGDPMKYLGLVVQTECILRGCGPAVSRRVDEDRSIVDTETQRKSRGRRKRTQHTDVVHSDDDNCRSRVGQVPQRRRERRVRGLEAVRDGMEAQASDEVCGSLDEHAGVQFPRRHSNQAGPRSREPCTTTRTSPQRP